MNDDERTDAALIAATARSDGSAFGVLVRRYIRASTLLAAQLVGDRDDAEDVVQDAFTVVYREAKNFDSARPFAPWFYSIVRRLASNRQERDRRRGALLKLWARGTVAEPDAPSTENQLIASLDAENARRMMHILSPMQRACFELIALRDLSVGEVALMHGITESTVRQHVFRARNALRDALGGGDETSIPANRETSTTKGGERV